MASTRINIGTHKYRMIYHCDDCGILYQQFTRDCGAKTLVCPTCLATLNYSAYEFCNEVQAADLTTLSPPRTSPDVDAVKAILKAHLSASPLIGVIALEIADKMAEKDPRFNREEFLKACGWTFDQGDEPSPF